MIMKKGLPTDKTLEGFYGEIEDYLQQIDYYTLSDNRSLLKQPVSPVYLPVTAYQKVLTAIGIMAYKKIGKDGQQLKESIEILISNL